MTKIICGKNVFVQYIWADCKAHRGFVIVILADINKTDLIWFWLSYYLVCPMPQLLTWRGWGVWVIEMFGLYFRGAVVLFIFIYSQWFKSNVNISVPYQLFSPSLQCLTLFLPVWWSSREFFHWAVSIEPSLSLCLLLGQVAFLITGPESTQSKYRVKRIHIENIRTALFKWIIWQYKCAQWYSTFSVCSHWNCDNIYCFPIILPIFDSFSVTGLAAVEEQMHYDGKLVTQC